MKINRNMSAVVANRQLLRTENKLSLSMGRLSSGYKINKAGDNPAGMAISSKMKAQIDGLNQAEANSDDGQSVLRIADGALNEVSNMLQRIRELSVQAANGTNSYSDRQSIQDEIDQLTQEVDRISTDTEYNKKTLLDGSANTRVYVSGTHKDTTKFARSATRIDFSEEVLPGDYTITVDEVAKEATYTLDMFNLINDPNFDGGTVSINGVGIEYEKGMSADDVYKQLMSVADEIGCKFEKDPNKAGVYNITIADSDIFEVGNLSRHILNLNNIGEFKELSVCNYLNSLNPHANVKVINDTLSNDDSFKTNIDLDRYDVIVDCTGENNVLDILQRTNFKRTHIIASVSVGLGAKRLYVTLMNGNTFNFNAFYDLISPYLQAEKVLYDDYDLPRNGIGCWHPTFPGRSDDIWIAAATSVKVIENYIISKSQKTLSLIYEQKESDGIFESYEVVEKRENG